MTYNVAKVVIYRPVLTIFLTFLFTGLCSIGWTKLKIEERPEKLYTPQNSRSFTDVEFVESYFGYAPRTSNIYMTGSDGEYILGDKTAISELFELYEAIIESVKIYNNEKEYTYGNYCKEKNGVCVKESILAFWDYNKTAFLMDDEYLKTINNNKITDCCGYSSDSISLTSILGGTSYDSNGNATNAKALRLIFYLQNNQESIADDDQIAVDLELEFSSYVRNDYKLVVASSGELKLYPITDASIDEEANGAIANDVVLVMISYIILIFYASFVFSKNSFVLSNSSLGIAAVVSIGCAIVSSFGLAIACDVSFSLIVITAVFLTLSVGVDDAFVIIGALERQSRIRHSDTPSPKVDADGIKIRLSNAMRMAGASITLTSCTNFAALLSQGITTIPSLSAFCVYASTATFFDYIFQITFFPAAVQISLEQQEANKVNLFPLIKDDPNKKIIPCLGPAYQAPEIIIERNPDQEKGKEEHKHLYPTVDPESFSQQLIGEYLSKTILHPIGKVVILLLACFFIAGGAYGATKIKMDFNYEWFVPSDSYLIACFDVRDEYFSQAVYWPVSVYTGPLSINDNSASYYDYLDELENVLTEYQSFDFVYEVTNWYSTFLSWASTNFPSQVDDTTGIPLNETIFFNLLNTFLTQSDYSDYYKDLVILSSENSSILATEFPSLWIQTTDARGLVRQMNYARKELDDLDSPFEPIVFSFAFLFLDGLAVIEKMTLQNFGVACCALFVICLIVLADIWTAFIVLAMVVCIDGILLGSLHFIGEYINMVTSINLIVSVGLSVDYSAHIAHSFLEQTGTRHERATKALKNLGVDVFHGGFSTFLGILVMAFSKSYIFRVFFLMILFTVIFGLFFGLCVLPIILSLIGSSSYVNDGDVDNINKSNAPIQDTKIYGHDNDHKGKNLTTNPDKISVLETEDIFDDQNQIKQNNNNDNNNSVVLPHYSHLEIEKK